MRISAAAAKAGNKTKTSQKSSFRNTRFGVLPSSIEAMSQLTVDAATKVALTAASVKLTVEIDAAGTRVFLADQRTGQLVGGPEDLSKLGGIRAFVTRERREASGIEIARVVSEISFRASIANAALSQGYVQQALDSSYGATIRPLLITLERLAANRVKLQENNNPALSDVFRTYLEDMFRRVRHAYYRHILLLTGGHSKKGQLAEQVFQAGVPEYVHAKITNQNFVLERGQELARVLFPQDPSKGLTLSLREWRDEGFMQKQGPYLFRSCGIVQRFLTTDSLLRPITRLDPSIGFDDETNPLVAKLLKAKVYVIPPMQDSRYVTEPGSKQRGGWKFPSPSMETPAGAISAFGVSLLRIYSANLQSVDLVGDYYNTIANGEVSRSALSPTNNFYVQWSNASCTDAAWVQSYTGLSEDFTLREATWRWIRLELRLSEKASGKILAIGLGLSETIKPVLKKRTVERAQSPNKDGSAKPPVHEEVEFLPMIRPKSPDWVTMQEPSGPLDLQKPISATETPLVDIYQKEYFPRVKKGKTKAAQGANLTRIGPDGRFLLESLSKLSKTLSSRMELWLRGFSDDRLQSAASKLALAQFDELFISEEVGDESDSDEDESESVA